MALASARTVAVVASLHTARREVPSKDLGRLGVAGIAAAVFLVLAIALARGGYEVPTHLRAGEPASPVPRAVTPAEAAATAASGPSSTRPGAAPTAPSPPTSETTKMREARATFEDAMRQRNMKGALEALEALVALDVEVLSDPLVRGNVVALAQSVSLLQGKDPERFLDLLATKAGTRGIDVLYELVTTKGGSRAAQDSDLYLRDANVLERASPALKIAWELRQAETCVQKKPLLARASSDGDRRALGQLQLTKQRCGRGATCCDWKDPELDAALAAIQARLATAP